MFEPKLWWQDNNLYIEDPKGVVTVYEDACFVGYSEYYENEDIMTVENIKFEQTYLKI
jgi:hypothetical protein